MCRLSWQLVHAPQDNVLRTEKSSDHPWELSSARMLEESQGHQTQVPCDILRYAPPALPSPHQAACRSAAAPHNTSRRAHLGGVADLDLSI